MGEKITTLELICKSCELTIDVTLVTLSSLLFRLTIKPAAS
jgi:hypothetical protein